MPAVSVILTSYNYAAYIDATIASVCSQCWTDWELVVVDDGSTDNSLARIARWQAREPRLRLLRHPDGGNHGIAASLRLGIAHATAPLLAFLESDDTWRADCLEHRLWAFSRHNADVVFNTAQPVPMGNPCAVGRIERYLENLRVRFGRTGPIDPRQGLWLANIVPSFSCAMLRRRLFMTCDLQAPVSAWLDWWIWFQLAPRARFVYLDAPLTNWRVHAGSYSASVTGVATRKRHMLRAFRAHARDRAPLWTAIVARLPAPSLGFLRSAMLCCLRLRRWIVAFSPAAKRSSS